MRKLKWLAVLVVVVGAWVTARHDRRSKPVKLPELTLNDTLNQELKSSIYYYQDTQRLIMMCGQESKLEYRPCDPRDAAKAPELH
jgi:hypothetical protein